MASPLSHADRESARAGGRSALQFVRRRVVSAVHRIDDACGRSTGRRRMLFDAHSPLNLAVLRPVIDGTLQHPRIDVRITCGGREDIRRAIAADSALAGRIIGRPSAEWARFDLYVNADPWNPASLRRTARRLNLFHGVAGKYDLDCPPRAAKLFDAYDVVGFVNQDRMRRYVDGGVVDASRAALVGYPKLDALVRGAHDSGAVRRALGLDPDRPTVIYAPTWSPASSLHVAGEAIIEALLAGGWNVIAKLHDNCFLPDAKYANGVDWRARLARFDASGRFALVEASDASPYLAASDVMVTDHSSIGFEFLALDRPLVVFDAPALARVARINPEKIALLRSAAQVVSTSAELARALSESLAQPAARSRERRRVAGQMFYQPGTATARVLGIVWRLLDLPQPSTVPGEMPLPAGLTAC